MTTRKTFTKEFKSEAVRLLNDGKTPPVELALQLGIRRNQLYKWKDQLEAKGEAAFPGHGRPPNDKDAEIARLKRELEVVKEEREILS